MSMTISDFTHGHYAYTNDAGVLNQVSMRNVYAVPSGLSLATGAGAGAPTFSAKMARRRYISALGQGAGGTTVNRHYPIAATQVASPTPPGTIDGCTFVLKGYRGERDRA
jgi:hypothetical protein